jgi:hypothetical protein
VPFAIDDPAVEEVPSALVERVPGGALLLDDGVIEEFPDRVVTAATTLSTLADVELDVELESEACWFVDVAWL